MLQVEHATGTFQCNVRSLSRNPYMECAGMCLTCHLAQGVTLKSTAISIMSFLELQCKDNFPCRLFNAFHS